MNRFIFRPIIPATCPIVIPSGKILLMNPFCYSSLLKAFFFAFASVLMESNQNLFIDVDNVCTDSLSDNNYFIYL